MLDQCFGIYNENKELQIIKGKNSSDMNILYLAFERAKFHYSSLVKIDHETQNQRGNPRKKRDRSEFESQDSLHNNENSLKQFKKNNYNNSLEAEPSQKQTLVTIKIKSKEAQDQSPIDFKKIFTSNNEELILWCIKIRLIFKPQRCQKCKRKLGKTSSARLVRRETYLDKYVWRCCDKECRDIRNIREGNRLLEMFSKVELKIILIYIFTHFCFLTPASASNKTLFFFFFFFSIIRVYHIL